MLQTRAQQGRQTTAKLMEVGAMMVTCSGGVAMSNPGGAGGPRDLFCVPELPISVNRELVIEFATLMLMKTLLNIYRPVSRALKLICSLCATIAVLIPVRASVQLNKYIERSSHTFLKGLE